MITLRMVAIAAAILVGTPVLVVVADHLPSIPGGDPLQEARGTINATVDNITFFEPPPKYDRVMPSGMPEQLVEGHIVFATIEIPLAVNRSEWNVSIVGSVSCELREDVRGVFSQGGIPFPTEVGPGVVRCQVGEQIFVSPDPFMEPGHTNAAVTPFTFSGTSQAEAPNGEIIDVHEYFFDVTSLGDDGSVRTERMYAWSVPVLEPFLLPDGTVKNWYCPIPEARLSEMGQTDFWAYHESELPKQFWATT